MADIVQIRDFQRKEDIDRIRTILAQEQAAQENAVAAVALFDPVAFPVDYNPKTQWPSIYRAEEKDGA